MAINKALRAALKALSYPELDVKKNYRMEREWVNLTSKRVVKPHLKQILDRSVMCADHTVPVRIFTPPEYAGHRVLVFFHGGGWVTGNIDSYDGVCADMASMTGQMVISVDYRLAPEHPFPAGLEDCYAAAREVCLGGSLLPFCPQAEEVTIIGDSAGGNLAAAVSLMARDREEFLPKRQILIYPATAADHSESSPFASIRENGTGYLLTAKRICDYMEIYRSSEADLANPYFAPLEETNYCDQPDTLIITAQYCPLRDEGEEYGHRLMQAGNRVMIRRIPDTLHGYFSLPVRFAPVRHTYEIINRFLKE